MRDIPNESIIAVKPDRFGIEWRVTVRVIDRDAGFKVCSKPHFKEYEHDIRKVALLEVSE